MTVNKRNRLKSCFARSIDRLVRKSYTLIRPLFGQRNVCIFPVGCDSYAYFQLRNSFFPEALVKITIRLLLCNPLTALIRKIFHLK